MIKCLFGHKWRFDWWIDEDMIQRRNEITCERCKKLKSRFWGNAPWLIHSWLEDHLSKRQLKKVTQQIRKDYG
jgi:macrodomain Ter protein organizer (MatP/YcbG family)